MFFVKVYFLLLVGASVVKRAFFVAPWRVLRYAQYTRDLCRIITRKTMRHLKQEFDKLTFKEVIIYTLAVVTMGAGLALLFIGLFIPPEGEIHSSVLTAFGTVCIFVASLLGISIHYANELDKFKANVQERLAEITQPQ